MNGSARSPVDFAEKTRALRYQLLVCLTALWLATPAAAEIYRCEEGELVVFSDLPCAEAAEIHRSGNGLSVVQAAEGLDRVAAENQAFVEQRRQRLAEQRANAERLAAERRAAERRARAAAEREASRNRLIIAPAPFGHGFGPTNPDRRNEDRRRDDTDRADRRTLLSRSGGGRPILRRDPPRYQ